jgi:tRNA(His) guanylyltransferase
MQSLGDRIKSYEAPVYNRNKGFFLLRVDGKAFTTYTRRFGCTFSDQMNDAMLSATEELLRGVQGSLLAYTQSDEISVLFTNSTSPNAELWMGGNLEKMVSISASIVTAEFNAYLVNSDMGNEIPLEYPGELALFDSRFIPVPREDVPNYFLWRWKDCVRNTIQRFARTVYSHKQLHGKSVKEICEMFQADKLNYEGIVDPAFRYGTMLAKQSVGLVTGDGDLVPRTVIRAKVPTESTYAFWDSEINNALELLKK